ncbi:FecR family protein [Pleomorphovibrio marinus]|uniref:FecR family protein n=1 Tax=Pleomorphovibrio marinus TaxID=2164132 RepID=UPI000E0CB85D|nr:FecR family protein [Pleomorphovibrio marinus]
MDITNYTTEDFLLDSSFREWVLRPNATLNIKWEKLIEENPGKRQQVRLAREMLLHLPQWKHQFQTEEKTLLWKQIHYNLKEEQVEIPVVPIHSKSTLEKRRIRKNDDYTWLRVAIILIIVLGLGYFLMPLPGDETDVEEPAVAFVERVTPPGVKAHITLGDGSKVILNANSKLTFPKPFDQDRREVFLEGEAYFEIAKDSMRVFSVHSGGLETIALGTSFNVEAYTDGFCNVALVSGKVIVQDKVANDKSDNKGTTLSPGEMLKYNSRGFMVKAFDEESVVGWTKKLILFEHTPLPKAVRVLENWYGVKFHFVNQPENKISFKGRFQDETLQNVMKGLSYAAGFSYQIDGDRVYITFNNSQIQR